VKAAQADGLTLIDENTPCPSGRFKNALVVADNVDFHWYRLDANVKWSHKPGGGQATNKDARDREITDLDTADRRYGYADYSRLCGYFCRSCAPGDVNIQSVERVEPLTSEGILWASMGIFSGREDPGWQITDLDDISILKGFLQDLPSAGLPNWPDLGWKGVMLENQGVADFPLSVHVFNGTIEINASGGSQYYEDVHGMETWLLEHMPDWDNDGLPSPQEGLLFIDPTNPDTDEDHVSDGSADPDGGGPIMAGPDNCPGVYNPDQADGDGDGIGDACESGPVGGIAELPALAGGSAEEVASPTGGSAWSAGNYAALGGGLFVALLASASAAWYARRRWAR
jgi:hypothetical protein